MALGYGQLSFDQIRTELNLYGGYGSSGSMRSMASQAGFGTPDAVSDFHGYTTPQPESVQYFTYGYAAYDTGYDWVCGDSVGVGVTNFNRYVNGGDVNSGLYGYYSLEAFSFQIVGITNGYVFDYLGSYCGSFL